MQTPDGRGWFRLPVVLVLTILLTFFSYRTFAIHSTDTQASERVEHCGTGIDIGLSVAYDTTVSNYRERYTMSTTDEVTEAWMEWWMRPTRFSRERVALLTSGSTAMNGWRARDVDINDHPHRLDIGVEALAMWYPYEGGSPPFLAPAVPDWIEVGEGPIVPGELGAPYPEIEADPIRVVERKTPLEITVTGRNFTRTTRMALLEATKPPAAENGAVHVTESKWTVAAEVPMTNLDFGHARVTLPAVFLSRPRLLALQPFLDDVSPLFGPEKKSWVRPNVLYVVAADSPVIDSIEPRSIATTDEDLTVTVRGSGFSPDSLIARADDSFEAATFVSPTMLQFQLIHAPAREVPLTIWIADADFRRMAEPKSIDVHAGPGRRPLPSPRIRSITPYPIPLLDYRSPKQLQLRLTGESFSREMRVVAAPDLDHWVRIRTTFVSPTELLAWLPRELWFWRRSSYRFSVKHKGQTCAVEVQDIDPDYATFSQKGR
jgi:hypothetical protein